MPNSSDFSDSYEIPRIAMFGAAGSSALIFSVLFLLFLSSQISHHPPLSTNTISEMTGYAEFFLFAFASYFVTALAVLNLRKILQRFVTSWIPISLFGSLIFCLAIFTRTWISDVVDYREGNPFRSPPGTYLSMVVFALVTTPILAFVAGIFSAIVSAICSTWDSRTELHLD